MYNPLGNGQSEGGYSGEVAVGEDVAVAQPAGAGDREPGTWADLPTVWSVANDYPWVLDTIPGTIRIPGFGDPTHPPELDHPDPGPGGETIDEDERETTEEEENTPDPGAGSVSIPIPDFNVIKENDGLIEPNLSPTIADEGGEMITLFTSSPNDVKHLTYKVRLVLIDPTLTVAANIADSTKYYPKVGYCYSAVPGDLDVITINPPKDLLRFSTPPMPLGSYHILLYAAETMELLNVIPNGLNVIRRGRSRITYSIRKRFPPLFLTGKEMLSEEVPYRVGKVPHAGT